MAGANGVYSPGKGGKAYVAKDVGRAVFGSVIYFAGLGAAPEFELAIATAQRARDAKVREAQGR
ncbi:MAG TPA: hypothetical protein VJQ50_06635 [Terriglobales bacterium]|nr:hypothetical protein [Terriglobales bacterium]